MPASPMSSGWSSPMHCFWPPCCSWVARLGTASDADACFPWEWRYLPRPPYRADSQAMSGNLSSPGRCKALVGRLVPGSLAIIGASFDERDRGRAIGTWSGATAITAALGPVLGGWLIEHFRWRAAFLINLPLAAVVLALTLWRVPESRNREALGALDWQGAALVTLGLGGLVYSLIESST